MGMITVNMRTRGFEICRDSIQSIIEAMDNAGLPLEDWDNDTVGNLMLNGIQVTRFEQYFEETPEGRVFYMHIRPAAGLILFTMDLWVKMPGRAQMKWRQGWPFLYCPPNDERHTGPITDPLIPNNLVPA